jgi:catechol 2,3-dioxygenase-like lactoylglutathione lyase family enzyme
VELSTIRRSAVLANHHDPGSSFLNFGVWDAKRQFDALREARPRMVGNGSIPRGDSAGFNVVWVRDPDDHLVEIMSGGWDTERKSLVGIRNVYRGHFGITMHRYTDAFALYRDVLGFDLHYGLFPGSKEGEYVPMTLLGAGLGIPADAGMAAVGGQCAHAHCEMFEFKGAPQQQIKPRLQDPGAAYLSLWVNDLDDVLKKLLALRVEIITIGAKPIKRKLAVPALMPGMGSSAPVIIRTSRDIMIRDQSGFPLLLRERVD